MITDSIQKYGKDAGEANLIDGMDKFISRLKNVQNGSQLASFLHTSGFTSIGIRKRSRGRIGVQPTSVSRRRLSLPRGRQRLVAGRPPKPTKTAPFLGKRKRCLRDNVEKNVPNAKTH